MRVFGIGDRDGRKSVSLDRSIARSLARSIAGLGIARLGSSFYFLSAKFLKSGFRK